jgi:hypothetical protein
MRYFWFATVALCLLAGCTATPPDDTMVSSALETKEAVRPAADCEPLSTENPLRKRRKVRDHVVRVNPDGLMVDPVREQPFTPEEADRAFRRMMCEAKSLARYHGATQPRLLVYVHGGLNGYQATDKKIHDGLARDIMFDPDDWHYPVFISWKSDALSNWGEHLFRLREGKKANRFIGALGSPFILIVDVATTVGRFPATLWYQVSNEKDRLASQGRLPRSWRSGAWKTANNRLCGMQRCPDDQRWNYPRKDQGKDDDVNLTANLSEYHNRLWPSAVRGTQQVLTVPVRYTLGSVWHSGVSSASWKVMKRRTLTQFFPASDFDKRWQPRDAESKDGQPEDTQPKGAELNNAEPKGAQPVPGGHIFRQILALSENKTCDNDCPNLTLVGHSMGTMVINGALQRFQKQWQDSRLIDDIVYMAAAASIEDSLSALKPILAGPDPVNFYNLTLNRVAEVSEVHLWGGVPTGSLLVSIDQHHERPEHPLRRTFGSEVNVLSSIAVIEEALRDANGELVFKAFDRYEGALPQQHGDFGEIPFWREETWQLSSQP